MSDVYFKGVPVNKAILVRHTPNGERHPTQRNNKGAIAITKKNLSLADDYICREGEYADKSDIEREATFADLRLYEQYQQESNLGLGLDYIARMGNFEKKGIERQFDATLWNQYGPVNRFEVEKEMINDGGAYIDSIVTVSREYAHQLGITTKQDFQNLMRSTWSDNCLEWESKMTHQRMFKNREDIRWVAAYHTDADKNIHVHIHTWNSKGTIQQGDTVLPLGTRKGKEEILKVGYANIRTERNLRGDFLRDLKLIETKHQLGFEISELEKQRLEQKAQKNGFYETLSKKIDLKENDKNELQKLIKKLELEIEKGTGKFSQNKEVQNLATKIINYVNDHSETLKELNKKNEELFMVKAGFKGLLYNEDKEDTSTKEWMEKELKKFIASEQKEIFEREKSKIIHEIKSAKEPQIELRKDLQRLDCSKIQMAENISFSKKLTEYSINEDFEENKGNEIYIKTPYSSPNNPQFIKMDMTNLGEINKGKSYLAKVELDKNYEIFNSEGNRLRELKGAKLIQFYGKANMDRIIKNNPEMTPELLNKEKKREAFKKRSEEQKEAIKERLSQTMPSSQLSKVNEWSLDHGMTLQQTKDLHYNLAQASRNLQASLNNDVNALKNNENAKMYLQMAAQTSIFGDTEKGINEQAHFIAEREGWNYDDVKQLVTEAYVEKGTEELNKLVDPQTGKFEINEHIFEKSNNQSMSAYNSSFDTEFGNLLASITEATSGAAFRGTRMKFRPNLDIQKRRDYEREQGISLKR